MINVKFILASLFLLLISSLGLQADTLETARYNAYLSGSLSLWKRALSMAEADYQKTKTQEAKFQLAITEYGLLNATMKDQDEDAFDSFVDQAVDHFEELIDEGYRVPESRALLAGITGFKIAYSPWKGMFLGPKSGSLIQEAIRDGSDLPIVQMLYANNQNFTPEMWGGSKKNAIQAYNKAIEGFEAAGETNNWMYLDAHAWLGVVLHQEGSTDEAMKTWHSALAVEPDFAWVSGYLIPKARESAKN